TDKTNDTGSSTEDSTEDLASSSSTYQYLKKIRKNNKIKANIKVININKSEYDNDFASLIEKFKATIYLSFDKL
ncbi:939_t:CDS:2, partial [Racocetra persica]